MIDQIKISLSFDGNIKFPDETPFYRIEYDANGVSIDLMSRKEVEIYEYERVVLDLALSKCRSPKSLCMQVSVYFFGGQRNFSVGEGVMAYLVSHRISLDISAYDL